MSESVALKLFDVEGVGAVRDVDRFLLWVSDCETSMDRDSHIVVVLFSMMV